MRAWAFRLSSACCAKLTLSAVSAPPAIRPTGCAPSSKSARRSGTATKPSALLPRLAIVDLHLLRCAQDLRLLGRSLGVQRQLYLYRAGAVGGRIAHRKADVRRSRR